MIGEALKHFFLFLGKILKYIVIGCSYYIKHINLVFRDFKGLNRGQPKKKQEEIF